MTSESTTRKLLGAVKFVFTPIALAYLIYFGWQTRDELAQILAEASLIHLGLALIAWCLFNAFTPLLAVTILNACGSKVGVWQAFSNHASRLPARYVPGGIWHTVGRVMDYKQQGVQVGNLTAFVILENVFAAGVALALGGAIVFSTHAGETVGNIALIASITGVLALAVFRTILNRRVLRQPNRIGLRSYVSGLGVMVAIWAMATTSFLLYINSFSTSTSGGSLLEMAGIYLFSWGVGFLAVFAPQGIGVFEFISSELLQGQIGFIGLAALIGGFRVIVLLADLAIWLLYFILQSLRVDEH